ncbi:MAG: histidine phosphatase family protein [Deltaproteobacteria bacterium]|nr:histidine phosphatase family protein [Deltaproteobacteria bacterium]
MNVYLVRHGQTQPNIDGPTGVVQGQLDTDLNNAGENQATQLAKELEKISWEAVYSSTLKRAIRTAEILVRGRHPVLQVAGLNERHCGDWQGRKRSDLACELGYSDLIAFWKALGPHFAPPRGETFDQMVSRSVATFEQIISGHPRDSNVLLVSHGGPIRAITGHLSGLSIEEVWQMRGPENCEVIRVAV